MNRRRFLATAATFASTRSLLANITASNPRIGICAFSCHQRWRLAKPLDAVEFYRYGRELGAVGVQSPLRGANPAQLRQLVEDSGGYYEADLRLPKDRTELAAFETEVIQARQSGATIARAVFTGGRRYEQFHSLSEFKRFHQHAKQMLEWVEPVLKKQQLKLAVENHKDHTAGELVSLLQALSSEWVGVLVDTGNNIALLEEPHTVVETLAPYAFSVHLKDMAVQACADGFLLSEVTLGTGVLDLTKILSTLTKANPQLVFHLEMATRDPLVIPCHTEAYFATLPEQKSRAQTMLQWVTDHPPRQPPPRVRDKAPDQILQEEENYNRTSLGWMTRHAVLNQHS